MDKGRSCYKLNSPFDIIESSVSGLGSNFGCSFKLYKSKENQRAQEISCLKISCCKNSEFEPKKIYKNKRLNKKIQPLYSLTASHGLSSTFALQRLVPPHSSAVADRHAHACLSLVVEPLSRGSNPRGNIKTQKNHPFGWPFCILAASHGFEPRLTESESAVLPLDDEAIS